MKNPKKYQIKLTPTNTSFPTHIWTEGGFFNSKTLANNYAKQLKKMKCSYNGKKKMYKKVEVI